MTRPVRAYVRFGFPGRRALEFTSNKVRFTSEKDISGAHEAVHRFLCHLFGQDRGVRFRPEFAYGNVA